MSTASPATPVTTATPGLRGRAYPLAILGGLGVMLVVVAVARLCVGSSSLGWPGGAAAELIWQARLHRLTLAVVVGTALSVAGVALQTLLRNPLAEPYILGLSTGAAAGVMGQSLLLTTLGWSFGASHLGALAGAGLSMGIVFAASRRQGVIDPLGLLLTGVVLSTINGAMIMLMNYIVGPGGLRDDLIRWMMGYLNEGVGQATVALITGLTATGLVGLCWLGRAMDVATLGDVEAQSLGVNLPRLRTGLFLTASVLAAGAVVLAGPIAFVGLICPHLGRLLLGPGHRHLLIASALIGATLIVLADLLSAAIHLRWGIGLMPIGIFTAMIGGPAFLWILRPQLGRGLR